MTALELEAAAADDDARACVVEEAAAADMAERNEGDKGDEVGGGEGGQERGKRPGDSESIQVKEDRGHHGLPTHEGVGKEEALGAEGTGPWKGEALPGSMEG